MPIDLGCIDKSKTILVPCYHGNTQTYQPTKRDGRFDSLTSPLHNADNNFLYPNVFLKSMEPMQP